MSADPETIGASILAAIPGVVAFMKWRGSGGDMHKLRTQTQNAMTKVAVVEADVKTIKESMTRVEAAVVALGVKLDRALDR